MMKLDTEKAFDTVLRVPGDGAQAEGYWYWLEEKDICTTHVLFNQDTDSWGMLSFLNFFYNLEGQFV